MAEKGKSGKLGKCKVGSTDVHVSKWSIDPVAELNEATDTSTLGYNAYNVGTLGATGQLTMEWDPLAHPTADPPNLVPGAIITTLYLYIGDPADDVKYDIPEAIVSGTPTASEAKGKVSFEVNFTVNGAFSMPT